MDPVKMSFLTGAPTVYFIALNKIREVDPGAHFADEKCSEPTYKVQAIPAGEKLEVFMKYFDALDAIHGEIVKDPDAGLSMKFSVMGLGTVTLVFP